MARTSKQRREQKRQNVRDLLTRVSCQRVYRNAIEQFIHHQGMFGTPFLDALKASEGGKKTSDTVRRYDGFGRSPIAEMIDLQRQYNEVCEITTRYIAMAASFSERNRRTREIVSGSIGEMRQRLESQMNQIIYEEYDCQPLRFVNSE